MCGIVGAIAQREVAPILLEGLKRLEYRGYDSAGLVVLNDSAELDRIRTTGKVVELANAFDRRPVAGNAGIAHTRWATHGKPTESNAHPHICRNKVAVVHNGIIENHQILREQQTKQGFVFTSDTDTEVIVHQVYHHLDEGVDLLEAVRQTCRDMEGAYALGVVSTSEPGHLIAARRGSPLVVGIGIGEYFIASDVAALLPVTQRFVFLEDGDIADLTSVGMVIYDSEGRQVERSETRSELTADAVERGEYRHYMLKEIHEQPRAIADTLEGRLYQGRVL
jgi:glucosamine--fructose-6-phosphate aminotransferase (isomerizing)